MKSKKNRNINNKLLNKVFKKFVLQVVALTVIVPVVIIIFGVIISNSNFDWLYNWSPSIYYFAERIFYFLFYSGIIYFGIIAILITAYIILSYRLLKKVFSYIDEITIASNQDRKSVV